MAAFMKKQGAGFYLNTIATVLGIAGLVAMVICSNMTSAYALHSLTKLLVEAVIGIVLVILAIYAPNRFGNHDYISTVSILAAIGLFSAVIGSVISDRILLISGLFSYNSGNMIGWSVFYATATSLACFLIAILFLIAGAFARSVKEV